MGTMAALNQALADRKKPKDVIYHSDRGVQYLSIRYTDKMAACGVIASVGTTGDSLQKIPVSIDLRGLGVASRLSESPTRSSARQIKTLRKFDYDPET